MAKSKKVIFAALAGNALIAITKFIASAITGSSAMLSEGIHSVVDTGNQFLLLFGIKRSEKPADEHFPYGHGKEIYFWSFVVAIMIFGVGAGISIYEGVHSLMDPHPVENPLMNYIVLAIAFIFEGITWFIAAKEFKATKGKQSYLEAVHKAKDPTNFVVLFEDSAALLGLVVAFLGVWLGQLTGNVYFDGIASVTIGLILAVTSSWLAYETMGLLIGESAEKEIVNNIRVLVDAYGDIKNVNEVLTMHMGPDYILLNLSVDFVDGITSENMEHEIQAITENIKADEPRIKRVFIEAENRALQSKS